MLKKSKESPEARIGSKPKQNMKEQSDYLNNKRKHKLNSNTAEDNLWLEGPPDFKPYTNGNINNGRKDWDNKDFLFTKINHEVREDLYDRIA